MLVTNLALQQSPTSQAPPAGPANPSSEGQPVDFARLLQGLVGGAEEATQPSGILTLAAALAGSSELIKDIEEASGSQERPKTPTEASPGNMHPLLVLQALITVPTERSISGTDPSSCAETSSASRDAAAHEPGSVPEIDPSPSPAELAQRPVLNLEDFDVRSFEFKTELEIPIAPVPKLIRVAESPDPQSLETADSGIPDTGGASDGMQKTVASTPGAFQHQPEASPLTAPESVSRVRVAIEPPPPPPVARQVSMDIGEADSQVHVVIRERNGDLALQFGAANERLRETLQNAAPFLLHQLQRESSQAVSLDFTSFGSATDSGRDSQQDSYRRKSLKSEAVFADLDETAYLAEDPSEDNSL